VLVIEHQRAAIAVCIQRAIVEKLQVAVSDVIDNRLPHFQIARYASNGAVQNRSKHQLVRDAEVPADADRGTEGVPARWQRTLLGAIGRDEYRVVTAVRQRA